MKVIVYDKLWESASRGILEQRSATCYYVPDKRIAFICTDRDKPKLYDKLYEAQRAEDAIRAGLKNLEPENPFAPGPTLSNIRAIEYSDAEIVKLIEDLQQRSTLETEIESGISKLERQAFSIRR